ncbi:hypothetical protein ACLPHM_01645 [Paenalcaligenes sp. Me131]|uniref:hypothetical protein n=1 Tax=Paenalcaligenes sp. Me131 TaxID=3392636 RepID=UPI003D2C0B62
MRHVSHSSAQQGQVLVLGIICLAVLVLLFNRAFWVGDISAAKMRQNSATDTAVYSAGLVQARLLNMLALLNRAYVAHHVASAHLATAASWGHFALTQAERFGRANPPASLIGLMFGPAHARDYASSAKALGLGERLSLQSRLQSAALAHTEFSNQVFGRVQQNLQQHFFALAKQSAEVILYRSYPEINAASRLSAALQQHPSTVLATVAAQSFVADWVRDSAGSYAFLQPRNYTAKNKWVVSARCPHLRHQLRRRGETKLDDKAGWRSGDTLSFHALRSNRWIGCYYREYAMGYAWIPSRRGQVPDGVFIEDPPDNFSQQDFWRWVREVAGWNLLGEEANPLASSYGYALAQPLMSATLQPALVLASQVSTVELALQVTQPTANTTLTTHSTAEVAYLPPVQVSHRPNLFMPYWESRLVAKASVPRWSAS